VTPPDEDPVEPDAAGQTAGGSTPAASDGVLSSLPGTRPQRRSPKRAARAATDAEAPPPSSAPAPDPAAPRGPEPPVAAQGFEAEPLHGAVQPPTGGELLAAIAHAAAELGELAVGLTGRLARSLLDRLPRL
jgi:hypothetical protein